MGLTQKEVATVVASLAKYFKEAPKVKGFIVTGGASLLLRGVNVETDDIDIVVEYPYTVIKGEYVTSYKCAPLRLIIDFFEYLKNKSANDTFIKEMRRFDNTIEFQYGRISKKETEKLMYSRQKKY